MHKDQSFITIERKQRASSKPAHQLCNKKLLSISPKGVPLHLQVARSGGLRSAPDSSMSSPSRSPMRAFGPEQVLNSGFWTGKPHPDIASGHCSSPGSGHNSNHNSIRGDRSGQVFRPNNKCSAECSPIPSPRMASPGPSSRIQSCTVTPLHPQAGGTAVELTTRRLDVMKQQTHRLPLPPITVTKSCPFSPTYSASTTPSAPRSPARAENPTSPGSRWTKGQLLGRGTFGHVYLGFNRSVSSGYQTHLYLFCRWTYDHCIADINIHFCMRGFGILTKQIVFEFAHVYILLVLYLLMSTLVSGCDSKLIFRVFSNFVVWLIYMIFSALSFFNFLNLT